MRTDDRSHDELAARVGRALESRATSEVGAADTGTVLARLVQVRAAAGVDADGPDSEAAAEGIHSPERGGLIDLGPADEGASASGQHWRRPTTVLAAAASVVLLAAVGVGIARWGGSNSTSVAPTAPSPSPSSSASASVDPEELWAGYWEMSHAQWPTEERGDRLFGDDVVLGSARLLTQVGGFDYWGAFTQDGNLCWVVEGPGAGDRGCTEPPPESAPAPVEVSDGAVAPQVWLVRDGTPTSATDPLIADGVIEVAAGVWVDAGALMPPPPLQMYGLFRQAPTAADTVSPDSAIVIREPLVPDSLRLVAQGETGTYYVGYQTLGDVCLYWNAPFLGMSASACHSPQQLAGEGFGVRRADDSSATAWLVPDDLDTSTWAALGRTQLAKNLWYAVDPVLPPPPPASAEEQPANAEEVQPPQVFAEVTGSPVPALLGNTEAEARSVLETYYGMRVGRVVVTDAGSAPSGIVVRTSPGEGKPVENGGAIDLFVSR